MDGDGAGGNKVDCGGSCFKTGTDVVEEEITVDEDETLDGCEDENEEEDEEEQDDKEDDGNANDDATAQKWDADDDADEEEEDKTDEEEGAVFCCWFCTAHAARTSGGKCDHRLAVAEALLGAGPSVTPFTTT
jgi:hypothetical protein